jgi:hypothetical protein
MIIDYGTGITEEANDLEEAKKIAEKGMTYTQESVRIMEDGRQIAVSYWVGIKPTEEEEDNVLQQFGDYGYYTNWVEE